MAQQIPDEQLFFEADIHYENERKNQIKMAEELYRCWESLRRQDSKYEEKNFYERIQKRYFYPQKKINQLFNLVFFNKRLDEEGITRKVDVFEHIDALSSLIKRHKMNGNRYILMERTIDPRAIIIWRMAVEDERSRNKRITPKILNSLIESYAPDKAKKKRKKGVSQSHDVEGDQVVEPETEQASGTFPEQDPFPTNSTEMEIGHDTNIDSFTLREIEDFDFCESGLQFSMDNLTMSPTPRECELMLDMDAQDQSPVFSADITNSLDVIIARALEILNSRASESALTSPLVEIFREGLSTMIDDSHKAQLLQILYQHGWKGEENGQFEGEIGNPNQFQLELQGFKDFLSSMKERIFDETDVFISPLFQVRRMDIFRPFLLNLPHKMESGGENMQILRPIPSNLFLDDSSNRELLLKLEAMSRVLPPGSLSKLQIYSLLDLALSTRTLGNLELIDMYWSQYQDHQLQYDTVFEIRELLQRTPEMSAIELENLRDCCTQFIVERNARDLLPILKLYDQFCMTNRPYRSWMQVNSDAVDCIIYKARILDQFLEVIRLDYRIIYTPSSHIDFQFVTSFLDHCIEMKEEEASEENSWDDLFAVTYHPTRRSLTELIGNQSAWNYIQAILRNWPDYIEEPLMEDGTTALEIATNLQDWTAVQFILEQPVNHDKISLGFVLKHAVNINPYLVKLLEEKSDKISQPAKDVALLEALLHSKYELVPLLIRMGALPRELTALDYITRDIFLLQLLLKQGSHSKNAVQDCLQHSAIKGYLSSLQILLPVCSEGQSHAVGWALENQNFDIAEYIIRHSIEHDFLVNSNALVTAAGLGNIEFVRYLIQKGTRVNLPDEGRYALFEAIECNSSCVAGHREMREDCTACTEHTKRYLHCVECLLNAKANVNQQDSNGRTPLHIAVAKNKADLVEILLQRKPDVQLEDNEGRTAYELCKRLGNSEILDIFNNYGYQEDHSQQKRRR